MCRQLLLLLIEGELLVQETPFLLGQGRLLRCHRRGLNTKGGPFPLQRLPVGDQGIGFRSAGRRYGHGVGLPRIHRAFLTALGIGPSSLSSSVAGKVKTGTKRVKEMKKGIAGML